MHLPTQSDGTAARSDDVPRSDGSVSDDFTPAISHISPLHRHPAALPYYTSDLLGRGNELAALLDMLETQQCIILAGPGGAGKTRLLQHLSIEIRRQTEHDMCFVALATITDPALVLPTIAAAIGVRENAGSSLRASLIAELRTQDMVLLLDNVEQVVAGMTDVATILKACPQVKVVVTSRIAPPQLEGAIFAVAPLPVPDIDKRLGSAELLQNPAVALFVERAQDTQAPFRLTAQNGPVVAGLCRALGGMPLALELAAAQIGHLSPETMLAQLETTPTVLSDWPLKPQDVVQTAIAWSYSLLGHKEQAIFARLAVFEGSFTKAAVETICTTPISATESRSPALAGIMQLAPLVAARLVQTIKDTTGETFMLPAPVRDYARAQLQASGAISEVQQSHAFYYMNLVESAYDGLRSGDQALWLARLEQAHPNIRAALRYLLDSGDGERAAQLAGWLARFWYMRGYLTEGRVWLEEALAHTDISRAVRAKALNGAGTLAFMQGDAPASERLYIQCLKLFRKLKDTSGVAGALNNLGMIAHMRGNYADATRFYTKCLVRARALNDKAGIAKTVSNLGVVARDQQDYGRAIALFRDALSLYQEVKDESGNAVTLMNLGNAALLLHDIDKAAEYYRDALPRLHVFNMKSHMAETLEGLAAVRGIQGMPLQAARIWGKAEALREQVQTPHMPHDRSIYERFVDTTRRYANTQQWQIAWDEGRNASLSRIIEEALTE